jgi:hypothetical protein
MSHIEKKDYERKKKAGITPVSASEMSVGGNTTDRGELSLLLQYLTMNGFFSKTTASSNGWRETRTCFKTLDTGMEGDQRVLNDL